MVVLMGRVIFVRRSDPCNVLVDIVVVGILQTAICWKKYTYFTSTFMRYRFIMVALNTLIQIGVWKTL
jgi:hypothetical protein